MEGVPTAIDDAPAGTVPSRQHLNSMDVTILAIDEVMRQQGGSGFETQMLVWLGGRLDVERLRAAIRRLDALNPPLNARLVRTARPYAPYWGLGAVPAETLREYSLESAEADSVLALAARLLAAPRCLEDSDPVSFVLVHAAVKDVVIVQFNHVLMDVYGIVQMLAQLAVLTDAATNTAPLPRCRSDDPLAPHLRTIPRRRVARGAFDTLDVSLRRLRQPTARLGDGRLAAGPPVFRCLRRSLGSEETQVLERRTAELCGFASLSMTLLASAFRAVGRCSDPRDLAGHKFAVGLGIDLGLRQDVRLICRNLVSIVPVYAYAAELADRERLVQALNTRLRAAVARRSDWGMVQVCSLLRRQPRLVEKLARGIVTEGLSLWFGYFGTLSALPPTFAGVAVEDASLISPCSAPAGMSLAAHRFRGGLSLQATYMPTIISSDAAEVFLDALVADLRSGLGDASC